MQVIKNATLAFSASGKHYVEAAPGSISIGDRVVQEIEEHVEVRKGNRLSPGGTFHYPAHSILVGFITGAGKQFIKDNGEAAQRFYIDNAVVRAL